jgi:hypothetical protein
MGNHVADEANERCDAEKRFVNNTNNTRNITAVLSQEAE